MQALALLAAVVFLAALLAVDRLLEQGLIYERKVPGVRRRLISRRSVVAFVDGPTNVAGSRGGGSRPGQLASLPVPAGGGLVVFENNTAPGSSPGAA